MEGDLMEGERANLRKVCASRTGSAVWDRALREGARRATFINCWYASNIESDAMWRIYGGGLFGVAIQSTTHRLRKALPQLVETAHGRAPIKIGYVQYVSSADISTVVEHNSFTRFLRKHAAYEHEHELRVLFRVPYADELHGFVESAAGHGVPIEVASLVETVVISPLAPPWFADVGERICGAAGYQLPVIRSIIAYDRSQ